MRNAVASRWREGSLDPPAVRPSVLLPTPGHLPKLQIPNRDTELLEMPVSQRKQTMGPPSNRYKTRHFHDAFSSLTHRNGKKRGELESPPNIDF